MSSASEDLVVYIKGGASDVWNALTSPEKVPLCYWGSHIEGDLVKGKPFSYVGTGEDGANTKHCWGEVVEIQPNKVFSHTYFSKSNQLGSTATYKIDPVNTKCTKLTIVETDIKPEAAAAAEMNKQGWQMILSQIKTVVETGEMLDTTPSVVPSEEANNMNDTNSNAKKGHVKRGSEVLTDVGEEDGDADANKKGKTE